MNACWKHHKRCMEVLRGLGWDPKADKTTPLAVLYANVVVAPLRRMYSWAVPNHEVLQTIRKWSPRGVVEMGAGTGYWSHLLSEMGVDVHPFDRHPTHERAPNPQHMLGGGVSGRIENENAWINPPPFCQVCAGGAEALATYSQQTLLLCWPPAEEEHGVETQVRFFAWECLRLYRGNVLIFIGEEGEDQVATAGDRFFRCLHSKWSLKETVSIPQWPCSMDRLSVWLRHAALPSSTNNPQCEVYTKDEVARPTLDFETYRQMLIRANQDKFEKMSAPVLWRKKRCEPGSLTPVETELLDAWMARATWWERLKAWG